MKKIIYFVLPIVLISLVVVVATIFLFDAWSKVENCTEVSGALCLTLFEIVAIGFLITLVYTEYEDWK